uniref:phospholipase A2 n=1 Tax=Anopheles maculatus TaxID=74869 RepID=A0A182T6R4_9DIPT
MGYYVVHTHTTLWQLHPVYPCRRTGSDGDSPVYVPNKGSSSSSSSSSTSSSSSSSSGSTTTGTSGLSSHLQRIIPHRFRPHFVNTAKGLRNIPAQLNDGQLHAAPEDVGDGIDQTQTSVGPSGQNAGSGGNGTGKTPGSSGGSSGTISSLFNTFKRKVKAIYPGTVWCGDGNQAKSENDIGFFYLTDSCCRAHDLCPITIAAGEQFNRLKNNGYFTRYVFGLQLYVKGF